MRAEVVYSSSNNTKEAYEELKSKIEELDFTPKFLLLFLTAGTWKAHKTFNELLKKRFPDTKMLGCIVEGYIAEDNIWMRGVAVLLADFEGEVEVFWAKEKSATKTIEKLGDRIGNGWDSILLMFPAFYFPGKLGFLRAFFTDRRNYAQFSKEKNNSREVLEKHSRYFESKFIFPINRTLKILAKKTGGNTNIIGMNLMNLEAASNTPLIIANFKVIGRGAAALCFKGKTNVIFYDVFPERGDSFEETAEIIKNYFTLAEEVNVVKYGVAIGAIGGSKAIDFLNFKKSGYGYVNQDEFLERVEKGKLQMATPYGLAFISKKTHGFTWLGLFNYPISIYPSLFDLESFYDRAIFCGEVFRGGIRKFGEALKKKKFNGFDFIIIDQNTIMSFGGDTLALTNLIKERSTFYLGVFSSFPSAYLISPDSKFSSEVDEGIFVNLTGTSAILEFG